MVSKLEYHEQQRIEESKSTRKKESSLSQERQLSCIDVMLEPEVMKEGSRWDVDA